MEILIDFMSGKISAPEFMLEAKTNEELQNAINSLIPDDAKYNPSHELWRRFSYEAISHYDFVLYDFIKATKKINDKLGDCLNIFGDVKYFYSHAYPDAYISDYYEKSFDLLLDVAGEAFEGKGVDAIVESIVKSVLPCKTKKERISKAKQMLNETFHIESNKKPRWIQGGEWPMGVNSPMKYIGRKRIEEGAVFIFQDVDSGDIKEVVQYY